MVKNGPCTWLGPRDSQKVELALRQTYRQEISPHSTGLLATAKKVRERGRIGRKREKEGMLKRWESVLKERKAGIGV